MRPIRNVLLPIVLSLFGGYSNCHAGDTPSPVWDGVFTFEQARRGELIYKSECANCHAADMRGGPAARGLRGATFQFLWTGRSAADLFNAMRGTMPPGQAGTLDDQAYLDVLAAILQRNEFPPGRNEIDAREEVLNSIIFSWERPDRANVSR